MLAFPWQLYLDNSSYVLHADETVVRYKALVRLQTSKSPFLQESELNVTSIHLPDWYALLKIKNTNIAVTLKENKYFTQETNTSNNIGWMYILKSQAFHESGIKMEDAVIALFVCLQNCHVALYFGIKYVGRSKNAWHKSGLKCVLL